MCTTLYCQPPVICTHTIMPPLSNTQHTSKSNKSSKSKANNGKAKNNAIDDCEKLPPPRPKAVVQPIDDMGCTAEYWDEVMRHEEPKTYALKLATLQHVQHLQQHPPPTMPPHWKHYQTGGCNFNGSLCCAFNASLATCLCVASICTPGQLGFQVRQLVCSTDGCLHKKKTVHTEYMLNPSTFAMDVGQQLDARVFRRKAIRAKYGIPASEGPCGGATGDRLFHCACPGCATEQDYQQMIHYIHAWQPGTAPPPRQIMVKPTTTPKRSKPTRDTEVNIVPPPAPRAQTETATVPLKAIDIPVAALVPSAADLPPAYESIAPVKASVNTPAAYEKREPEVGKQPLTANVEKQPHQQRTYDESYYSLQVFLQQLSLSEYFSSFQKHAVTLELLDQLSESEWKEVAVPLGVRKRIQMALSRQPSAPDFDVAG